EEGLDVPGVDLVVFYEPVPSEIRFIQRRGRTGRARAGRAVVLIAKGTKDEAFFWSARRKEKALKVQLGLLRGARGQRLLREF
ncbi:MAG: helicase-related protein, partial [Candidatus Norongarragalinales archaeon]